MSSLIENIKGKFKEFKPTSWVIDNKTAAYIATVLISLFGFSIFSGLPKESFPDIVVPQIYVTTVYVGTSPKDMESLVTRPIEKQIKGLTGAKIKKVTSNSLQDFSSVLVEFDTDVKVDQAKQKVRDAVDKAKTDLPTDLTMQPNITEVAFSDLPVMYVNVSGDYDAVRLKSYADKMKDRFEELPEITRAEIVGAPEREIQVDIDPLRMQSAFISFSDIEAAIARENRDISGGLVEVGDMKRALRIKGQFNSAYDLRDIVIKNIYGKPVYLKDIASLKDTVRENESFARLGRKNVITLNIVKRAGENLINAAEKVRNIIAELQDSEFPKDLKIVVTGDQSVRTETDFRDLINTIIIGFILVLIVLMFFMGVNNSFFVALSVPLSVFIAFSVLPIGDAIVGTPITLNFIVLFALLFGLGIIVDDAIVVIENTHRIYGNGRMPVARAAKMAAGEVFVPVLAGTLTTLAPFFPLLFWKGIIGKFMIYLPTILILTLTASLIVAFLINPVFAVSFMKPEGREHDKPRTAVFRSKWFWAVIGFGVIAHLAAYHGTGNFLLFIALLMIFNSFVLKGVISGFQNRLLPALMRRYEGLLRWILKGWRPVWVLVIMFIFSIIIVPMLLVVRSPDVVFFPSGDPNFIYVYLKLPVGTSAEATNTVTKTLEDKVYQVLAKENPGEPGSIVESVISNVAVGATDPQSGDRSVQPNRGRIQISFVPYEKRHGRHTAPLLDSVRAAIKGIPGAEISVDQESSGPPTGAPVNIEISGEDFAGITSTATALKNYLDSVQVQGVEDLKMDVDLTNPEVTIIIDRERALMDGLSTGQIGMELRTAVFGKEVSKLKENEDEYKIQLRYNDLTRNNMTDLMNMKITYRDFTSGQVKQVPVSSVARMEMTSTLGGIKRKNLKRVITLYSNVLNGFTPFAVNEELTRVINEFKGVKTLPEDVTIKQTGEGEEQAETSAFLGWAMLVALMLIFIILVAQFNSISKPMIVLTEIFFSVIGVLLGIAITGMNVSTIMVGIGVVGLAGIVVKNGILLIEFTDELRGRGVRVREAAIQAGKIRIIPVLLTALATMLGLIPLAIGLNMDFVSLFRHFDPKLFFGGDNVVFWGPLSWTIIFGLIFAFFMTLIMVPSMYIIAERLRRPMEKFYGGRWVGILGFAGPLFFLLIPIMYIGRRLQGKRVWNGLPARKKVKKK